MTQSDVSPVYPYCLCTTVAGRALKNLLENTGRGTYKDSHPWLIAQEFQQTARGSDKLLPILFATGSPSQFSHWAFIENLSVVELHHNSYESLCEFSRLEPVNPIWTDLDTVFLKPSNEQLQREVLEDIHQHRYPLTEGEIHPYAICETPPFILQHR
jgi:hypothetical protein